MPTPSSRSSTSLLHAVPATLTSCLCSALFLLPRTPSLPWPPGKLLRMQQNPDHMPAGRSGAAPAPAALVTQTFPRDSSRECPEGQALSGHPAALQPPPAAMSSPRARREADAHFGEKQPSLHQMEGDGQFPRHVLLLPAALVTIWVFALGQGWRRRGHLPQRTPTPATSRLVGTAPAGESGVSSSSPPWHCPRLNSGKACSLPGPQSPQLYNGELASPTPGPATSREVLGGSKRTAEGAWEASVQARGD